MLFEPYLETIADAYDALPLEPNERDRHYWEALGDDSQWRAAKLNRELRIDVTDDQETYPDVPAMIADVDSGHFVVSRASCEHPFWTPNENIAFRIVHDVLGHVAASKAPAYHQTGAVAISSDVAGFDWPGENRACGAHFPLLSPTARVALFTECIAQTGYAIARGGFGAQKVGVIRPNVAPGHPLIAVIADTYGFAS